MRVVFLSLCLILPFSQSQVLEPTQLNNISYLISLNPSSLRSIVSTEDQLTTLTSSTLFQLLSLPFLNIHLNDKELKVIKGRYETFNTLNSTLSQVPKASGSNKVKTFVSKLKHLENGARSPNVTLNLYLDDLSGLELAQTLNSYPLNSISSYVSSLDKDKLKALGSKPDFLPHLTNEILLLLGSHKELLSTIPSNLLLSLIEQRPFLLSKFPLSSLELLLGERQIVSYLSASSLYQILKEADERVIFGLSSKSLSVLLSLRPKVFSDISVFSSSLQKRVHQLLKDPFFLSQVSTEALFLLSDTEFRRELDVNSILLIVKAHPHLPLLLTLESLEYFVNVFVNSPKSLSRISCSVILTSVSDIGFVNRLTAKILKFVLQDPHIWNCLPPDLVTRVLTDSNIGEKLRVADIVSALRVALTLPQYRTNKGLLWSAFRYQGPIFVKQFFEVN